MDVVFIIGLPAQLQRQVEAIAGRTLLRTTKASKGKKGSLQLLPHPQVAVHTVRQWSAEVIADDEMFILVLPYAPVPESVIAELKAMEDLFDIPLQQVVAGEAGWPAYERKGNYGDFLTSLLGSLRELLAPAGPIDPSDYLAALSQTHAKLLVSPGALAQANDVASLRRTFLCRAGDALAELADKNGRVGNHASYFHSKGLLQAQSGGINATITVFRASQEVHSSTTNTHLKQGDKTTRRAAARLYYECFEIGGTHYVAILYAGPHPKCSVSRRHDLD